MKPRFVALSSFSLAALATALAPAATAPREIDFVPWQYEAPRYKQELTVRFRTPEATKTAKIDFAPLFDGCQRAISCRWDDNNHGNIVARERMERVGVPGTFYLNSITESYIHGGIGKQYLDIARGLLKGGNSIGCHAYSHPYLSYTSRNRMFEEIARDRIEWESALDSPVISHAFSFVDYRSTAEGDVVQADIIRTLERAGIYHICTNKVFDDHLRSDLVFSVIMPPENSDFPTFKAAVDWAVGDADLKERMPLISNSMHAWYNSAISEYGWDELDRRLDYMAGFPNFWRCNQNQYAAYRYQWSQTRMKLEPSKTTERRFILERPTLRFLNDTTPLTLRVTDVAAKDITEVLLDGTAIAASSRSSDETLLSNLPRGASQKVPTRIGRIENENNTESMAACPDFEYLRGVLRRDGVVLRLSIENAGSTPLEDITVTWRSPVGIAEGVMTKATPALAASSRMERTLALSNASNDPLYFTGNAYHVAQVDFVANGEAGRLYLTCHKDLGVPEQFPHGRVRVFGPVNPADFQADDFARFMTSAELPFIDAITTEKWSAFPAKLDEHGFDPDILSPEVVATTGSWFTTNSPLFILQTSVELPEDRNVEITTSGDDGRALFLENTRLDSPQVTLKKGSNLITLVYHHVSPGGASRHSAAFLRINDAATGKRLQNLRYVLPDCTGP